MNQILIIVTDQASGVRGSDLTAKAKPFEDEGIVVVPVAVGDEADPKELERITPDGDNVIRVNSTEDPRNLGEEIMGKALKGKYMHSRS